MQEYTFKVQLPSKDGGDSYITIGKATENLSRFIIEQENNTENHMMPVTFKVGSTSVGYIKLVISTIHIAEGTEDTMTEISGLTGLTSEAGSNVREQDLEGAFAVAPIIVQALRRRYNSI